MICRRLQIVIARIRQVGLAFRRTSLGGVVERQRDWKSGLKRGLQHIFFCSLQRIPSSRVAEALPLCQVSKTDHGFIALESPQARALSVSKSNAWIRRNEQRGREIPVKKFAHVICGILSETEFRKAIEDHFRIAAEISKSSRDKEGVQTS